MTVQLTASSHPAAAGGGDAKNKYDVAPNGGVVKDLSLAAFGRQEIELAEHEMPGLMALRQALSAEQPLRGVRLSGSLHMTIQTAVLIETLSHLGAELRWCSCNIFSTQDHAAAAIQASGRGTVFAWKGESLPEYWWCCDQALSWPAKEGGEYCGPNMILDDGGDMTILVHQGAAAEAEFEATGKLAEIGTDAEAAESEALCMARVIRASIERDPRRFREMAKQIRGVSEETTTGVHRLYQLAERKQLLFPAMNVNDAVTKSKFDNIYGCRHSLPDGIMRATDLMIGGKKVLICGFGDVGKGCAQAMKGCGGRVFVTEIDPICALQACMEGFEVVRVGDVVAQVDIFVTCTGNKDIITGEMMSRMKHNAVVCNIGHFDNEIQVATLPGLGARRETVKPQVDKWIFPDGKQIILLAEGRLVNLGCATGHPSFVMSCSFTNQVLAQIELWKNPGKYANQVYLLPKKIDEEVARLHLDSLGARLTQLTPQQAEYINVPVAGPYKSDAYRY